MSEEGGGSAAGTARSVVTYTLPNGDGIYTDDDKLMSFAVTRDMGTLETFVQTCMSIVGLTADGFVHTIEVHPIIPLWLERIPQDTVKDILKDKIIVKYGIRQSEAYASFNSMWQWINRNCPTGYLPNVGANTSTSPTVWHYIVPLSATLVGPKDRDSENIMYTFDNSALLSPSGSIYTIPTFLKTSYCKAYNKETDKLALHTVRILLESGNTTKYDNFKDSYNFKHNVNPENMEERMAALTQAESTTPGYFDDYVYHQSKTDAKKILMPSGLGANMYFSDANFRYKLVNELQRVYDLPGHQDLNFPTAQILNATTEGINASGPTRRVEMVYATMAKMQQMPTNQKIAYIDQFASIQTVLTKELIDNPPVVQVVLFPIAKVGYNNALDAAELAFKNLVPFTRQAQFQKKRQSNALRCIQGEAVNCVLNDVDEDFFAAETIALYESVLPDDNRCMRGLIMPIDSKNKELDNLIETYDGYQIYFNGETDAPPTLKESFDLFFYLMALRFSTNPRPTKNKTRSILTEDEFTEQNRSAILTKFQLWIDLKLFMLLQAYSDIQDTFQQKWAELQMEVLVKIHALLNEDIDNESDSPTTLDSYIVQDILVGFSELQYYGFLGEVSDSSWSADPDVIGSVDMGAFLTDYWSDFVKFATAQSNTANSAIMDTLCQNMLMAMQTDSGMGVGSIQLDKTHTLKTQWCKQLYSDSNILATNCIFEPLKYACYYLGNQLMTSENFINVHSSQPNIEPNVFTKGRIRQSDTYSRTYCKYQELKQLDATSLQLIVHFPGTYKTSIVNNYQYMRAYLCDIGGTNGQKLLGSFAETHNFGLQIAAKSIDSDSTIKQTQCAVVTCQWENSGRKKLVRCKPIPGKHFVATDDGKQYLPDFIKNLFFDAEEFNKYVKPWLENPEIASLRSDTLIGAVGKKWLKYVIPNAQEDFYTQIVEYFDSDLKEKSLLEFVNSVHNHNMIDRDTFFWDSLGKQYEQEQLVAGAICMEMLSSPIYTAQLEEMFRESKMTMDEELDTPVAGRLEAPFTDSSFLDYTQSCMSDAVHAELPPTALLDFSARFNREMEPHVVSELLDREHPLRSLTSGAFCAKVLSDFPTLSARARHEWEPWVAAQHAAALAM